MVRETELKEGILCRLFGKTPRNAIVELFLECRALDFSVGDIARETEMNRMTTHNNVKKLVEEGILEESRVVSGTQLYKLSDSGEVLAYIQTFDDVLLPMIASGKLQIPTN